MRASRLIPDAVTTSSSESVSCLPVTAAATFPSASAATHAPFKRIPGSVSDPSNPLRGLAFGSPSSLASKVIALVCNRRGGISVQLARGQAGVTDGVR
eukprot:3060325-Rhodomonas_salina.2